MKATFQPTVQLAAEAKVCLVSDLHLGDGSWADAFGKKDDSFRRFLDEVVCKADAFVICGDGFDVAQAWSMDRVESAHRATIEALIELSRTMPVYYLRGNHEGSAKIVADAVPLRYANELRIGDRVLVEHGNAHDPYNLPGDKVAFLVARYHALLERAIQSPVRVPMRKYHCWSTRVGHWLFYRCGQALHGVARVERKLGFDQRAQSRLDFLDYWGRGEWGDPHGLLRVAMSRLALDESIDTLIFGHSHQAGNIRLGDRRRYINTGSWAFEDAYYAWYDASSTEVRSWPDHKPITDGEYRGILGPHREKSFFDWWAAYYRGWLSYDVEAMLRECG